MKLKIGSKSGLKRFSMEDIRAFKPCYDPKRYLPEDWKGTAVDILDLKDVSVPDRLWVVLRTEITSERVMRLFAVWCARQVQHLMKDPRSIAALDVAERFANGQAAEAERAAAWDAARAAARDAAWAAAWAAAWDAARAAAWAAARAAAGDAAGAAARAAAGDAARDAQISKLKEMLIAEGLERLSKKTRVRKMIDHASGAMVRE